MARGVPTDDVTYPTPCPLGHTHYGRCVMWRCHCRGEHHDQLPDREHHVGTGGD